MCGGGAAERGAGGEEAQTRRAVRLQRNAAGPGGPMPARPAGRGAGRAGTGAGSLGARAESALRPPFQRRLGGMVNPTGKQRKAEGFGLFSS